MSLQMGLAVHSVHRFVSICRGTEMNVCVDGASKDLVPIVNFHFLALFVPLGPQTFSTPKPLFKSESLSHTRKHTRTTSFPGDICIHRITRDIFMVHI